MFIVSVHALHPTRQAQDLRLWITQLDALRRRQAAGAKDDDCGCLADVHPCHFSPGTTIKEKYGEDCGSTSSSGTIFWLAMVARSTYSAR